MVIGRCAHFLALDLELLGCARCQRDVHDLAGIEVFLFCEIGLDGRALHTDGAFCSGQVGQQFGVIELCELDPAWAAASELGQGSVAGRNALDQLAGLLDDGQIGSKVGVEYIVDARCPQQRDHFSFYEGTRFQTEGLTQCHTHRRRSAYDHDFVRVCDSLLYGVVRVAFHDAVGRTDIGTLTAVNTDGLIAGFGQRVGAVNAHALGTHLLAHAASDAFLLHTENAGVVQFDGNADG